MRLCNAVSLSLIVLGLTSNGDRSHAQDAPSAAQSQSPSLDPAAEYNLGGKTFSSNPVTSQSLAEGITHYRNAANAGYVSAQRMLGAIYEKGVQVDLNYSEAAHWYEMAAEQGDEYSEFDLGRLYEDGLGVSKNLAIAVYWYEKAEQKDNASALARRMNLTSIGVVARAPDPSQLPPTVSAYSDAMLEPILRAALQAKETSTTTHSGAPAPIQAPAVVSAAVAVRPSSVSGSGCHNSIAFAIAQGRTVDPLIPDFAEKWVRKNQKDYHGLCFSQKPTAGAENYVFVFSTAQDSLSGFQPVVRTSTSTSTSPVQGNGTITSTYGGIWQYTYNGTVTATTTTTSTENVPFTLRESTLYLTVYNSSGSVVQRRWATDSRQLGGDPYQALGYNLGSALRNMHLKEKLLKAGVQDVAGH